MTAFHRFEENLLHYHCLVCKETWPLFAARYRGQKRDRKPCRLYSSGNDMDPGSIPAELQGLSEVKELLIARAKHGSQRTYGDTLRHVLSLLQVIQGFLNSLTANVSHLPILVIRKQLVQVSVSEIILHTLLCRKRYTQSLSLKVHQ